MKSTVLILFSSLFICTGCIAQEVGGGQSKIRVEAWSDSVQNRLTHGGDYLLEPRVIIGVDSIRWYISGLNGISPRSNLKDLQRTILAIDSVQFTHDKSACKFEAIVYFDNLNDYPYIQKIKDELSSMNCLCILYLKDRSIE
jgi:hypothetical protein